MANLGSGFHKSDLETKGKRGGTRKGAGSKRKIKNPVVSKVYLDAESDSFFLEIGEGNRSAGIRKAVKALKKIAQDMRVPYRALIPKE